MSALSSAGQYRADEDDTWLSRVEAMRIIRKQRQKDLEELQSWKFWCLEHLATITYESEVVMNKAKQFAKDAEKSVDASTLQRLMTKVQEVVTKCHKYTQKFDFASDSGDTHTIEISEATDIPDRGGENDEGTTTVTKLEFLEQQLAALKSELDYHKGKDSDNVTSGMDTFQHEENTGVYSNEEGGAVSDELLRIEPIETKSQTVSSSSSQSTRPNMTSLVQQAHQSVKLKNVKTRGKGSNYRTPQSGKKSFSKKEDSSLEGILKRSLEQRFASTRESIGSEVSPSSVSDSDSNIGSPSVNDGDSNQRRISGRKSFSSGSRRRLSGVKSSCGAVVSLRPQGQPLQTVTENQSNTHESNNSSGPVEGDAGTINSADEEKRPSVEVPAKKPPVLDSIKGFDVSQLKSANKRKQTQLQSKKQPKPEGKDVTSSIASFDKSKLKPASNKHKKSTEENSTSTPSKAGDKRKPFSPSGGGSMLDQIKSVNLRSAGKKRPQEKENSNVSE